MDAGGSVQTPELGPDPTRPGRRRPKGTDQVFKWVAAVAGAALIGFVVFVVVRGPSHPTGPGTAALESPPSTSGGGAASPASLLGTPVVVNFFASWCRHCRAGLVAMVTVAGRSAGHVA